RSKRVCSSDVCSSDHEECTTDVIKEMYDSYGDELLGSATFDGKRYAFPNTAIDDGHMLLWLRSDWIRKLGLEEPRTMDEAMQIKIGRASSRERVADTE